MTVDAGNLRTDRLSIVLPVATTDTGRDGEDLRRTSILLESFLLTFSLPDLHRFSIISPPRDLPAVSALLRSLTADARFTVVSELDICPELASDPPTWARWPHRNKGWFRQQLIKLSCCRLAETALTLTFDADIVCVRKFGLQQLMVEGRARCGVETPLDYDELYVPGFAAMEARVKQERVDWAQRVLGKGRPERFAGRFYSETPTLYDTDGIARLAASLEERYQKPWRRALLDVLPWTEQALYFHFLETEDLFDTKYCPLHRNAVLRLDESIWQREACYRDQRNRQLEHWQPAEASDDDSGGFFVAFQSSLSQDTAALERAWRTLSGRLGSR
jgi:hypothetical protein